MLAQLADAVFLAAAQTVPLAALGLEFLAFSVAGGSGLLALAVELSALGLALQLELLLLLAVEGLALDVAAARAQGG